MSFPLYPEYKDSGTPWLGELPAHWELRRTKFLFNLMKRLPREADGIVTAFRDGEVTLRSNRRVDGFTNALQEIGYQGVRKNDLVIHAMDAFAGAVGVSDSDGKSTPVYSVCTPIKPDTNVWYYSRLLRHMALSGFINSLAKGVRERSTEFRWADAGNTVLPVPTPAEQSAITTFLDRETAKIDALVAEYARLIELLKEKRQAVISHAVTKGLDPKVPMKDSGVEWLGEVPTHWVVCKVRRLVREHRQGYYSTDAYTDEGVRLLRITDLRKNGRLDYTESPFVENKAEISAFLLQRSDFVFARTGGAGTFGIAEAIDEPVAYASYLIRFRFSERVAVNFLKYFFLSGCFQDALQKNIHGGVNQNVHAEDIKDQVIAVPTAHEQADIATYLDRETAKFDALMAEAEKAIDLLNERRSALISAAVTGKIDVRGLAAAAACKEAA